MSKNQNYKDIELADLEVNSENPRHPPLADEITSINWLLNNITDRMKKLSLDILENGKVYDPPLVKSSGKKWLIYDGNRRVACLKLLNNPNIIQNPQHQLFYRKITKNHSHKIPTIIKCRVEENIDEINAILERRHAGGETGIGQMPWGPEEKDNFFRLRGVENPKPNFGNELNHLLKNAGVLSGEDKIPVSILNRLLSNETYRNMVGITFKNKKIQFVAEQEQAIKIISKIIDDTKSGKLNLNKAWSTKNKDDYFLELVKSGTTLNLSKRAPSDPKVNLEKKKTKSFGQRNNLIPTHVVFPTSAETSMQRAHNVFKELQSNLNFSYHSNAIAVLFRVYIELCADYYLETQEIKINSKNKYGASLAERFSACLDRMVANSLIKDKDRKVLVKFKEPDRFLSIDTFNAYIHHKLANPIQSELISKWDTLEIFLSFCLSEEPIRNKNSA